MNAPIKDPASDAGYAWPYREVRPQRYNSTYKKYLARGGILDIADFARRYTKGTALPDPVRFFMLCHVFDQIQKEGLGGDFVEIGVYKGDTAALLAEAARKMDKTAYLLDTFEGFDAKDFVGIDSGRGISFADTSMEAVQQRVGVENTKLIQGYFPATAESLPPDGTYSLVHIDCDLFLPIMNSLEYFYPRMAPGGFFVVHDYNSFGWDGAEKAVDQFFAGRPECVVPIPDGCGSVVIRKARASSGADNWQVQKKGVAPNVWARFGAGAHGYILDAGWSAAESWGVWGVGHYHTLTLVLPPGPPAGFELDLDLKTALPPAPPGQMVQIEVDGEVLAQEPFTAEKNRHYTTIKLPAHLSRGGPVTIGLRPSYTLVPKEVNPASTDGRRLGVALHGLRLRAV